MTFPRGRFRALPHAASAFRGGSPGRPIVGARPAVLLLVLGVALLPAARPAAAQTGTLRVEENFRADPNGTVIGRLMPGTRVEVVERQGNWVRATLRGFVWLPSLRMREVGAFDLEVSEPGGENLRDEAAGRVGARLLEGTLLEEVGRIPGWAEVRRTAWIWAESLDLTGTAAAPQGPSTTAAAAPGGAPAVASSVATAPPTGPAAAAPPAGPTAGGAVPGRLPETIADGWLRTGGGGSAVLSAPGGDTLARTREGAELRVLAREGNWIRVQMDGWVWAPQAVAAGAPATPAAGPVADADPAIVTVVEDVSRLTSEFERLRGRPVEVRLQFISLERAEQVRTDFYEGEPFLLMRSLEGERSFVYVAIPAERLEALGALTPLETVRVVGRLRSGAAAFTGSPILDLVEIERIR